MDIKNKLRHVLDFPKVGIDFIDIAPLMQDGDFFKFTIDSMADEIKNTDFDLIVSSEARGFLIGAPIAYSLGKGFAPVRKQGKLPFETVSENYSLEYGKDTLEMHIDAVLPGQRVVLIDDILATGGTIEANIRLVEKLGGVVVKIMFLAELTEIPHSKKIDEYGVFSLVKL